MPGLTPASDVSTVLWQFGLIISHMYNATRPVNSICNKSELTGAYLPYRYAFSNSSCFTSVPELCRRATSLDSENRSMRHDTCAQLLAQSTWNLNYTSTHPNVTVLYTLLHEKQADLLHFPSC